MSNAVGEEKINSLLRTSIGRPARMYLHKLCTDTGCSLEDLPGAMEDREGGGDRFREIRAVR